MSNYRQSSGPRHGRDNVTIRKMYIVETGTFHDIYNRPYQMELGDGVLDQIRERLHRVGQAPITSKAFKNLPSGILAPVSSVDGRRDLIRIPDGWDRARLRFMLHVTVESGLGETSDYYLQGFSDHLGVHHGGNGRASIDQEMRMFINGFIRVQEIERMTPRGREIQGVVKQAAQVINGRLVFDVDRPVAKTRAVDLYSDMQLRMLAPQYGGTVRDTRSQLTSPTESIFARRDHCIPENYLSTALDAYRRNSAMSQFGVDSEDVLARTQQDLNSDVMSLEDNAFLRILSHIRGESRSTEFTMKDLIEMDPGILTNDVVDAPELTPRAANQLATRDGDVSDWRGEDLECRWAQQTATNVTAIMMQHYHQFLDAHITNMNHDNRVVIQVADAEAIAGGMPRDIHDRMLDVLEEAFEHMSENGRIEFSVFVTASLYNQTKISVSVNGGHEQLFYVPTFADGLMSPFYARDTDALGRLSEDLERLITDVSGEVTGSSARLASGI